MVVEVTSGGMYCVCECCSDGSEFRVDCDGRLFILQMKTMTILASKRQSFFEKYEKPLLFCQMRFAEIRHSQL